MADRLRSLAALTFEPVVRGHEPTGRFVVLRLPFDAEGSIPYDLGVARWDEGERRWLNTDGNPHDFDGLSDMEWCEL